MELEESEAKGIHVVMMSNHKKSTIINYIEDWALTGSAEESLETGYRRWLWFNEEDDASSSDVILGKECKNK
ncbi:hypothetical protein LINPERHAP1_LOCUS21499 [Linum perenne]